MSIARLRPFPVAALLILVGGISMVVISWDWTHAWIDTSLTLLVLMSALAPALQGRRLGAIHAEVAAAPDGAVPSTLRNKIEDPVLWSAVLGMGGVLLGVVTLMTLKSDSWPAAVAIIVVSTILGMAAGHALGRPAQAPEERPQPARADAAKS